MRFFCPSSLNNPLVPVLDLPGFPHCSGEEQITPRDGPQGIGGVQDEIARGMVDFQFFISSICRRKDKFMGGRVPAWSMLGSRVKGEGYISEIKQSKALYVYQQATN